MNVSDFPDVSEDQYSIRSGSALIALVITGETDTGERAGILSIHEGGEEVDSFRVMVATDGSIRQRNPDGFYRAVEMMAVMRKDIDDPYTLFSRGKLSSSMAVRCAGVRDYATFLIELGKRGLSLPAADDAELRKSQNVFVQYLKSEPDDASVSAVCAESKACVDLSGRERSSILDHDYLKG